jgi:monoamine oxidase
VTGAQSDEIEKLTDAKIAEMFLSAIDGLFPGAKAAWTGKFARTHWRGNPLTRGCCSYATPGSSNARLIIQEPLNHKLWFAGEAVSVSAHSTMVGAYFAGQRATDGALGSLGML